MDKDNKCCNAHAMNDTYTDVFLRQIKLRNTVRHIADGKCCTELPSDGTVVMQVCGTLTFIFNHIVRRCGDVGLASLYMHQDSIMCTFEPIRSVLTSVSLPKFHFETLSLPSHFAYSNFCSGSSAKKEQVIL